MSGCLSRPATTFLTLIAVCLPAHARLCMAPEQTDLRSMIEKAPVIFRGRQAGWLPKPADQVYSYHNVRMRVVRAFRGSLGAEVVVKFPSMNYPSNPGRLLMFTGGREWLVFANPERDSLHLSYDSCYSALPVAPVMAEGDSGTVAERLEADFLAGLRHADPKEREFSVHRLGGLRSLQAFAALRAVLAEGSPRERFWAADALLSDGQEGQLRPHAIDALAEGLIDPDPPHRATSFRAMQRYAGTQECQQSDPPADLDWQVSQCLAAWKGRRGGR